MTTLHPIQASLVALSLGLALGLTACGGDDAGSTSPTPAQSSPMSQMPTADTGSPSSSSAAARFNEADVTFVHGMLPHHRQAVELSDTVLAKSGISAETRALAEQVKAVQQPEITTMEGWLTAWGESADSGTGGMEGMHHGSGGMGDGMATDADLSTLDRADGVGAEKVYLELMTKHHQGAIAMAKTEVAQGENPDAVTLADSIATSQQAEIDTMKQLLTTL